MQFVFTIGTVVLGLFVASKVFGMEPGKGAQGRKSAKGQKWGSGRCVIARMLVRLVPSLLNMLCLLSAHMATCAC